jgi:hypothetical protein
MKNKETPMIEPAKDYSALLNLNMPPVYAPAIQPGLRLLSPEQNVELTAEANRIMQGPLGEKFEQLVIRELAAYSCFQRLAEHKLRTDQTQAIESAEKERVARLGRMQTAWLKIKTTTAADCLRFWWTYMPARQLFSWDAGSNSLQRCVEVMSLQPDNVDQYVTQQLMAAPGHVLKAKLSENKYSALKCGAGEFPILQQKFGFETTLCWLDSDDCETYLYRGDLPCQSALTDTARLVNDLVCLPLNKVEWVVSPSQFGEILKGTDRTELPTLPFKLVDQLAQLKSATDATRRRFFKVMSEAV